MSIIRDVLAVSTQALLAQHGVAVRPAEDVPMPRTLYDWRGAPEWAVFAATDSDGAAHYFACRPSPDRYIGRWDESSCDPQMCDAPPSGSSVHWTQSLERRP